MTSAKDDILLVNRNEEFLAAMCAALRQAGYAVHLAMDMRGALTAIASQPVGLIVCDSALRDVTGHEFLHYLKCDPLRESIPFVFFVPLHEQGRAFKAFQLGAVDFLVYPMEVADFIRRIREIMPSHASVEPMTGAAAPPRSDASEAPKAEMKPFPERREKERTLPLPHLPIEVSRDGVVWLPGRLVNFSNGGLFVQTGLLGKDGLSLNVRFSLPGGPCIVQGEIRHITFNDFQQPAGIGIQIRESAEWTQVSHYLDSLVSSQASKEKEPGARPIKPAAPAGLARTMVLPDQAGQDFSKSLFGTTPQDEEESFDIRFYNSLIGKQLDNYKALSFIGAGTMGGVLKGWDIALERAVAIKVISYKLASQEAFREMFIKEARIVSKLNHANIAHIYYIGNTGDILYYVMEFISGTSMKDLIDRHTNLNTLKGLDYLIAVCQALDFVSKMNIIHRDIKPENMMINDKGVLKVVDFGVAMTIDADAGGSRQEGIVGSPLYISPDCISGRSLDQRSDIYSLGASFYHAFTGFLPFEGKDAEEVLLKHLHSQCVPLNEKNPKVSRALGRIIEKMMAKDPSARYQNYGEIIDDLRSLRSRALKFQQLKNSTLILKLNKTPPSASSSSK